MVTPAGEAEREDAAAGVLTRYREKVAAGEIAPDPSQEDVAARLDRIAASLPAARPPARRGGLLSRLVPGRAAVPAPMPKGLYVWGEVGRGKTMLMDLFFEVAPIADKRRAHFNVFMQDVHARIRSARERIAAGDAADEDPIPPVAAALHAEARLLCFDEFAVNDVADAMILGRLFRELFRRGLTLVATSNVAPDDLYPDGLNRARFMQFVALMKERVDVVRLEAATDYRLDRLRAQDVYFPADAAGRARLDRLWREMTRGLAVAPATVAVAGREVRIEKAAGGLARTSFAALCGTALGAADYIAIARRFHTLFLEDVPVIAADARDTAMRFITLVDVLYENRVRLVVTAEAEPEGLVAAADGKEAFAAARTASRLHEMRSESWLASAEELPLT